MSADLGGHRPRQGARRQGHNAKGGPVHPHGCLREGPDPVPVWTSGVSHIRVPDGPRPAERSQVTGGADARHPRGDRAR